MAHKLEKTLNFVFIALILINFNFSHAATECEKSLSQGQYKQALNAAESTLKTNPKLQAALLCKGRSLTALEKTSDAETTFKQAVEFAAPGFDAIIANLVLGNFYQENKQFDTAITQYQKALAESKKDNNQKFTRISHNLMGETYALNGQAKAALASYQAGEPLSMNDNERADSYERLAISYEALNQLDQAIEYQLKGSMMQRKAGSLDQYAEANLNLGRLFTANKEYSSADNTLNKLLKFAQDNGGLYYEAKSQIYLAKNKQAQGDAASAKALLADAKAIANKIQANDLKALIEEAMQ